MDSTLHLFVVFDLNDVSVGGAAHIMSCTAHMPPAPLQFAEPLGL